MYHGAVPLSNGKLHKYGSVRRLGSVCGFFYLFFPGIFPKPTACAILLLMGAIGFDNQKYLTTQSEQIKKRIHQFGGKLYLEFGGKLFDDYHASRVLPGFEPDSKIRMLQQLKDDDGLKEAVKILNDPAKYKEMLSAPVAKK